MAGVGVSLNYSVSSGAGILSLLQQGVSVTEVIKSWVSGVCFVFYIMIVVTVLFINLFLFLFIYFFKKRLYHNY